MKKAPACEEIWLHVVCAPNTYSKHSHGHQCWIQLNIKFIIFSKEKGTANSCSLMAKHPSDLLAFDLLEETCWEEHTV